jgi:hypothetical protein
MAKEITFIFFTKGEESPEQKIYKLKNMAVREGLTVLEDDKDANIIAEYQRRWLLSAGFPKNRLNLLANELKRLN